jgi:hypothetical protein
LKEQAPGQFKVQSPKSEVKSKIKKRFQVSGSKATTEGQSTKSEGRSNKKVSGFRFQVSGQQKGFRFKVNDRFSCLSLRSLRLCG